MSWTVSPADRFREALMEAVGQASLDFSGYCRLAGQAMLQAAMRPRQAILWAGPRTSGGPRTGRPTATASSGAG